VRAVGKDGGIKGAGELGRGQKYWEEKLTK